MDQNVIAYLKSPDFGMLLNMNNLTIDEAIEAVGEENQAQEDIKMFLIGDPEIVRKVGRYINEKLINLISKKYYLTVYEEKIWGESNAIY